MDRRKFLQNSSLVLGASTVLPAVACNRSAEAASFATWNDIRSQFQLEEGKIHMAQMLLASHPKPVREAITKYREAFDNNPAEYWEHHFQTIDEKITQAGASYLHADHEEVALTDSTTQGLGILYSGLKLKEQDEILTTTHDHYSTILSLDYASRKTGASIRRISLYDDPAEASVDEILERLSMAIGSNTRIVAVTWVHSCTGVKLPIGKMAEIIQSANEKRDESERIYFCVDGVHGFGVEDIDMKQMGCDFFAAGTHKWLFGPRGTGILWGKRDAWDMLAPVIPPFRLAPFEMYLGVRPDGPINFSELFSPGGFHAFEHRWALIDAFEWHLQVGKSEIEKRTHELNTRLKAGLASIDHIKLHTPVSPDLSSGINCFDVDGMPPHEVVEKLHKKKIIGSTSPYPVSYARLTPCVINTEEEVDRCIRAMEDIHV